MDNYSDIDKEFDELNSINYSKNYSIGYVFETFAPDFTDGDERNFSFKKDYTESESQKRKYELLRIFSETLIDCGNMEWAIKNSGINKTKAYEFMRMLNERALEKGLPPVYILKEQKKNRGRAKLKEKQVTYIKYLMTKYSVNKIAKMYGVSPSTIDQIKNGLTWIDIIPIIKNEKNSFYRNGELVMLYNPDYHKALRFTQVDIDIENALTKFNKLGKYISEKDCRDLLEQVRWDGVPVCPHCGSINVCKFNTGVLFKCRDKWCRKKFSVTVDSIYANSRIELRLLFIMLYILVESKFKCSTTKMAKVLGVTQKSCWIIMTKMKEHFNNLYVFENGIDVRKLIIALGLPPLSEKDLENFNIGRGRWA